MPLKRLVVILVTFLVASAVASPLLSLLQGAVGPDLDIIRLPAFATAIGAAVVWLVWRQTLAVPQVTKHGVVGALVLAVVLAATTVGVLFVLDVLDGGLWPPVDVSALPLPLAIILVLQLLGAAGEEIGWRGIVQPLLERRFSLLWSGVFTGALFGLGHFYVLLVAGPVVYAAFVMSAIGLSVTLAVLTTGRSLARRVLIATFFHWLVNAAMLVFFSGGDETLLWTVNTAIATGLVAVVAMIVARRGRENRRARDDADAIPALADHAH